MSIPAGITVSSPIIGGVVELFSAIFCGNNMAKDKLFHGLEKKPKPFLSINITYMLDFLF